MGRWRPLGYRCIELEWVVCVFFTIYGCRFFHGLRLCLFMWMKRDTNKTWFVQSALVWRPADQTVWLPSGCRLYCRDSTYIFLAELTENLIKIGLAVFFKTYWSSLLYRAGEIFVAFVFEQAGAKLGCCLCSQVWIKGPVDPAVVMWIQHFLPLTGRTMCCAVKTIFLRGIVLHLQKGVEKIAPTVRRSARWKVDCYHNCCNQLK